MKEYQFTENFSKKADRQAAKADALTKTPYAFRRSGSLPIWHTDGPTVSNQMGH
jgi:hypothetical protein